MQPSKANYALVETGAEVRAHKTAPSSMPAIQPEACALKTDAPESAKFKDVSLVADVQKEPECLSLELGDALLQVFKTFTGR
jgi:hypothetical protein